jgi:hypothetical protein
VKLTVCYAWQLVPRTTASPAQPASGVELYLPDAREQATRQLRNDAAAIAAAITPLAFHRGTVLPAGPPQYAMRATTGAVTWTPPQHHAPDQPGQRQATPKQPPQAQPDHATTEKGQCPTTRPNAPTAGTEATSPR